MQTQPGSGDAGGIDVAQFHAVFFEEADEHLVSMEALLLEMVATSGKLGGHGVGLQSLHSPALRSELCQKAPVATSHIQSAARRVLRDRSERPLCHTTVVLV